jgi:hypothetical protein
LKKSIQRAGCPLAPVDAECIAAQNIKIKQTIMDNSQLVIGNKLPGIFQRIIEHTDACKALMATWKEDDIKDLSTYTSKAANTVVRAYPDSFVVCVGRSFTEPKKRQEALQNFFQIFSLNTVPSPPECN